MKKKRYEGTINSFRVGKGPATRRDSPSSSFLPKGNSDDETKQSIQTPQARREITVGHIHAQALQTLLYDHIQFLPATNLTFDDESKMALIVRPRRALSIGEPHSRNEAHQVCGNATTSIPKEWKRQSTSLPWSSALRNHGNRCYRNAILQAFLHIPKIVNWLELGHVDCHVRDCTLCWFKGLCTEYWNRPCDPRAINDELVSLEDNLSRTKAFRDLGWDFREQHDAGDFAVAMMDAIIETNSKTGKVLNAMIGHIPVSTKICSVCESKTTTPRRDEQHRLLLVGWERPMALEQILQRQTFSCGTFQLDCERCKRPRSSVREERLWTTPDVLIIQLQRFEMRPNGRMRKKMDIIPYPEELDLTEFSEGNARVRYGLQAVVHHRGSLDEGHYIAVAKGPRGRWELINDLDRPQMRTVPIKAALSPENKYTPYLLFYVKLEGRGRYIEDYAAPSSQAMELKDGLNENPARSKDIFTRSPKGSRYHRQKRMSKRR